MKRQKTFSLFLIAFILLNMGGCVYDKLDDCPQGINVHFFSKSVCDVNPVYPSLSGLKLFVFDENNNLVAFRDAGNDEIAASYSKTLKVRNGLFTVVAWGGLSTDAINVQEIKEFTTTKKDALFRMIQNASGEISSPEGTRIYFGESQPIFLPDPAEYGSIFKQAEVNMQEVTNRLTVQIEGLPQNNDFEITIESENSGMNLDGSVDQGSLVKYVSTTPVFDTAGVLQANLTTLQMLSGYNTALVIKNKTLGTELYRGDLLGTLLLKNPNVNLACDHDFTIRFTVADKCDCGNYMIMEIWVNNWLVHSYSTDL
jgi:hypothetical protein